MGTSSSDGRFLNDDGVLVSLEGVDAIYERDSAASWWGWTGVPGLALDNDGFW